MSNLYGGTTKLNSTPYLTIAEFKSAPTAIDYNNLVVNSGDPAVQDAELNNAIARASSWIDTYCNQVLAATLETEQQRTRMRPDGTIVLHPRYNPVVALLSLSYGTYPNQMNTYLDCSQGWIEDTQIVLPYTAASGSISSAGPLQFGIPSSPSQLVFCKYQYVAGYTNTVIGANASANATTLTVKDASGITAGMSLQIYDGSSTELVTVADTYTFNSTTVPLTSGLLYAHNKGISISALPPAIKEAAILATTAFLKVRGDYSLTMQVTNQVGTVGLNRAQLDYDLALAKELLQPFRRMR